MANRVIYAEPRLVTDIANCFFYHTIDVPGYGLCPGQWDLRATIEDYLAHTTFAGKRVLDIGTADGFICFHIEKQGAQVVAYDLSEDDAWDLVPFVQYDYNQYAKQTRSHIQQLNNAFWLAHRAFGSSAKMLYGTVYAIPPEIGSVDIAILGSILLHTRDPFAALRQALAITKETVIVAEPLRADWLSYILRRLGWPYMQFLPDFNKVEPKDAWWYLPPAVIIRMVGALGFEDARIHYHYQQYGKWGNFARVPYYTIVARRTKGGVMA